MEQFHATTILCVRRDGLVAIGGDGQATLGDTVVKSNAVKVRVLKGGKVIAGFAGAVADAFTLFDKFEEKIDRFPDNLPRVEHQGRIVRANGLYRHGFLLAPALAREVAGLIVESADLLERTDADLPQR